MIQIIRRYLIRILTPINKIIGRVHFSPKNRALKADDIFILKETVVKGDVIISFTAGELTNFLIDGEYKHCAVYVGDGMVVEAVGRGVVETRFIDFCSSKDKVAICRPKFANEYERNLAAEYCKQQIGKPYDYNFEPEEDSFYCAELAAESYKVATNERSPFLPREVMGVLTVLPVDYKLAGSKFQCVMEKPSQVGS